MSVILQRGTCFGIEFQRDGTWSAWMRLGNNGHVKRAAFYKMSEAYEWIESCYERYEAAA